jgi:hypothetical protein
MALLLNIAIPLVAVYLAFLAWYGGRGKPLSRSEIDQFMLEIARRNPGEDMVHELQAAIANDDGNEFVMQNLARYRPKAIYPPGYNFDDNPRAADMRYGKAIVWPLLRQGSVPIFIAKRTGSFIEPEGADAWHYVAMVRYRSRRDFLKFALAIDRDDIVVHKWAALEKTHVFPVKPLINLVYVRALVGLLLGWVGFAIFLVAGASR